jgi:hypothetical protein
MRQNTPSRVAVTEEKTHNSDFMAKEKQKQTNIA